VLPGVTVRLTPEGEVLVQGPNVMAGYWHDPERTAEVLRDGWLHTGDLATIDSQGNLSITGRAKDLIVLPSGLKVWPQDVEEVLRAEPAVRDAAIMGVPTATGGLKLHAYLLPASPAESAADLSALVARCNGRLAQHQRITTASWWAEDDFLRTAMGKVRRHLLPLPSATQTVAVESVLADDDPVGQAIAGLARVPAVLPGQTLGDLGLDSLGLVELALALEEKTGKASVMATTDLAVEQVRASLAAAPEREADATGTRRVRSPWAAPPVWPYTWGRRLRFLSFPVDLLYRYAVTRTVVTGQEHLDGLSPRVIFAGTHHGFADMPLVRYALARTPARHLARRLVIATVSTGIFHHRFYGSWARLAFGLYPLSQASERDASLRGLVAVATRGNVILIFPQGVHASPEQERRGDPAVGFRPGVAYLAEALGAPVVPFGLAGTERLVPPSLENYRGRRVLGIPLVLRRGPLAITWSAIAPPAGRATRRVRRSASGGLLCPDPPG
jgi:1-acyl-sn-glycerol-3-phosphate acyltransferase